jgi:hypothetical protein
VSATRLLNTLLRVKHISRCETSTHRDDVFTPEHEPERKSRDTPTHGGSVISFLGRRSGIELLSRFSRSRDDFCSNDSLVTIWAHRSRLDVRAHALLRCRREDSSANANGAGHSGHRFRVRGGLDRQIYSIAWPLGLGYSVQDIRPRHLGGDDPETYVSPRAHQPAPGDGRSRRLFDRFQLLYLNQCRLWRRLLCTSYCAIFGNGKALAGQLYPSVLIGTLAGMSLQERSSAGTGS